MNYPGRVLISDEIAVDDEIDNLFCQLEQIQPPPTLVEQILASVARLSHAQLEMSLPGDSYAGCVVSNDSLLPS